MVQAFFAEHGHAEMAAKLRAARIAYGAVNDLAGLSAHPQLRRLTVASETGEVAMPAHPNAAQEQRGVPSLPRVGEHGARIRAEFEEDA